MIENFISDNIVFLIEETSKNDKLENTLAIIHAINHVCNDIKNLKKNIMTKWLKINIHKIISALKLFFYIICMRFKEKNKVFIFSGRYYTC